MIDDPCCPVCPVCRGSAEPLGVLGARQWLRCLHCGTPFSRAVEGDDADA